MVHGLSAQSTFFNFTLKHIFGAKIPKISKIETKVEPNVQSSRSGNSGDAKMGLVHCLVLMVMLRPPLKIKCNKQSAWRPLSPHRPCIPLWFTSAWRPFSPLTPGLWVIYHRVACRTAMMRSVWGLGRCVWIYTSIDTDSNVMALARINDDRAGKVAHIRMLTCTLGENSKSKSAKRGYDMRSALIWSLIGHGVWIFTVGF